MTEQNYFKDLNYDRANRGAFVATGRRELFKDYVLSPGTGIASEWRPVDGYSVITINLSTDIDSDISCDVEWSFDETDVKELHGKTAIFGSGEQPTQLKSNLGFVSGPFGRANLFNNGASPVTINVWGYARTF